MIYVVVLTLVGLLVSSLVPMGANVIFGIIFAITLLNYRKTLLNHKQLQEIRSHLGLLGKEEAEELKIETELNRVNQLTEQQLSEVNAEIELEIEQRLGKKEDTESDRDK